MSYLCTVYNASHEPLAIVEAERGLVLFLEGKAFILETQPERRFRSPSREFPVPSSIILKEYQKTGSRYYGAAQLNQRNLFLRDGYTCQYCHRHDAYLKRGEYLTRDHVLPVSRGGQDAWENVVTCCSTCNHRKDDHTVAEFLKLLQEEHDQVAAKLEREEEQLEQVVDPHKREKREAYVVRLRGVLQYFAGSIEGCRALLGKSPKQPTVHEILLHRSTKRSRVA